MLSRILSKILGISKTNLDPKYDIDFKEESGFIIISTDKESKETKDPKDPKDPKEINTEINNILEQMTSSKKNLKKKVISSEGYLAETADDAMYLSEKLDNKKNYQNKIFKKKEKKDKQKQKKSKNQ
jgi:hypothetical protein